MSQQQSQEQEKTDHKRSPRIEQDNQASSEAELLTEAPERDRLLEF